MEILILVLKVIGGLLLAVLAILMLLLLLILLVPVRYRLAGACREGPDGKMKVGWPWWLLSGEVVYKERSLALTVRAFGLRVFGKQLLGGEEEPRESEPGPTETPGGGVRPQEAETAPESAVSRAQPESGGTLPGTEKETREPGEAQREKTETFVKPPDNPEAENTVLPEPEPDVENTGRIAQIREKIVSVIQKFTKKKSKAREKKERLFEILLDEENQKTFRLLCRQAFRLIRHILPYRADGWVRFGFEDPYTTGQVLTYLSPFYALYAEHITLTPVFGGKELAGELTLRGRVRIGTVLILGLRVFADKNFRRLLRRLRER